jgi:hypothetical protein
VRAAALAAARADDHVVVLREREHGLQLRRRMLAVAVEQQDPVALASRMPRLTAAPLPRLSAWRTTAAPEAAASRGVSSVEPSSTTMTS